jgi:hypothetical protein
MRAGDQELWAIGMVAVQWSILEGHIKAVAHGLFGDDNAARVEFDNALGFQRRLRMLREPIDRRVINLFRADLIDIVDYIGAIAIGRDKIIHGTWSSHQPPPPRPDEPRPSDETTHVSTTAKPRTTLDWRISYDRTIAAVPKIDAASSRLSNYLASVVGKPSLFLMSDALQRISRPPDSGSQNQDSGS